MVRDKKISVEEGARLLDTPYTGNSTNRTNSKWIKIKVTDPHNSSNNTNITLPASLFSVGIKLAERFSPDFRNSGLTQADLDEINSIIDSGVTGKVVNIETTKGEKVEVIIE